MRIKSGSVKYKLLFSYVLVVFIVCISTAFFLNKTAQKNCLPEIKTAFVGRNYSVESLIFALGLSFILGALFAARIFSPIGKMLHICRKFRAGDLSHRIRLDSRDEIGELADIFNKLAEDLENKTRETEGRKQHLGTILESMAEGIIVVDKDGCIVLINSAARKIFNVQGQEPEGKLFLETIRNNDIADILNGVLKNGVFISRELSLVWPVKKVFQVNVSPLFVDSNMANVENNIKGCLLVVHDITEIRGLENIRRDFVANVSHELRTPLTSIRGFVETLLDGALEDKENSRRFLEIIQEQGARLNNLIDDLLDLSQLESRGLRLKKVKFNVKNLMDEILGDFEARLKQKFVSAESHLPGDLNIEADRDKIRQVLINLIDNAIKFNRPNGTIKIYSRLLGDRIKMVVEDSGIGISPKDIPRIFERFYRVDKARSRELGGTGLGLSIVKHIVELHEGSVGVESVEGFGSEFWFILPTK